MKLNISIVSINNNFHSTINVEDSFIIPKWSILTDIPFCEKNKNKWRDFVKKIHHFANRKYRISVYWVRKRKKVHFLQSKRTFISPARSIIDHMIIKTNYITWWIKTLDGNYNAGHNILALFNNLAQVQIATGKTILDI